VPIISFQGHTFVMKRATAQGPGEAHGRGQREVYLNDVSREVIQISPQSFQCNGW
jgi:hypothetical protein